MPLRMHAFGTPHHPPCTLHAKCRRAARLDLDGMPGPWRRAWPVVGNILECLRPDFHRVLLGWSDTHGGIFR